MRKTLFNNGIHRRYRTECMRNTSESDARCEKQYRQSTFIDPVKIDDCLHVVKRIPVKVVALLV